MNGSKEEFLMKNTRTLVIYALLTAIIILMAITPIGYFKVGVLEITFITIPVIVGAILLGKKAGAFLGAVFGITSFVQCFGMSAFGATLLSINPILTFILCFVPRLLMGYLCGLIFELLNKNRGGKKIVPFAAASLSGALLNTILFTTALILMFGSSEYIQGIRGGMNIAAFVAAFVGINGVTEALVCSVVGTAVSKAVYKFVNK